jgi:hypothetical protein
MREALGGCLRLVTARLALLLALVSGPVAALGPSPETSLAPNQQADARSATNEPRRHIFAERLTGLRGIENVGRITPNLYRGSAPNREGIVTLKSMGIKTVVNLRHYHGKTEERRCREAGLGYVRIVLESSDAPKDEAVRLFLRTVTDPSLQPIYFHCWRGKDRTGAMGAVYRMTVDGWPLEAAQEEMQAFGFFDGWRDLLGFVKGFPPRKESFWPFAPIPQN